MIFAFRGGNVIQAQSRDELVDKLKQLTLFRDDLDDLKYITAVAEDCLLLQHVTIRIDSNVHFIGDLLKEGYIIEIDEKKILPARRHFRK